MAENSWCSKADIIKDLVEVTGKVDDVDERFIVVGEMPPPPMPNDEEVCGDYNEAPHIPEIEPDLDGISQMLRKVEDETADEHAYIESSETTVISKLNPNVPEFIPKCATSNNNEEYGIIGMSSKWNSKYAIMQDLYLAQGCEVPAELEGTVSAGEKPPVLNILEETEEAFFKHCEGGGDFQAAPDFSLIKEMLEMIQDKNILKDNEKQSDSVIEISKPRNTVQTKEKADVIKKNITSDNNCEKPNNKIKKKHKNVAVSSILEAKAAVMSAQATAHVESNEKEALKLLKPNDFMMSDTEIAESVEKVNDWLDSHQENTNRVLTCQPNLMFKKKSISAQNSIDSGSIKSSPKPVPTKTTITMFQPTQLAAEYYKKYVERSKLNESVQEDIWKRAENIMRKIDTKRRLQAVEISQPTTSQSTCNDSTENKEMTDKVRLSHHRHLLTHKCVVCEAIEKNGIEVNTKIVYSDEFDTCPLLPEKVVKNA